LEAKVSDMESVRNDKLGRVASPHRLKDQDSANMETPTAPQLTYFNGQLWLGYRTAANHVVVGCRTNNDITDSTFQTFDLASNPKVRATSDDPPTLCGFNGRLYIAWKADMPNGRIKYQSTDGAGNWQPNFTELSEKFQTSAAPVLAAFNGRLYLAYLSEDEGDDGTCDIFFSVTQNGKDWSEPQRQDIGGYQFARSSYPPSFSIFDDNLQVFWGAGTRDEHAVYYSGLPLNSAVKRNSIDQGKWRTPNGSSVVYRPGQQWIFSTAQDEEISVATDRDFRKRSVMSGKQTAANALSSHACAAAIVPGFPGKLGKPWRIFVIWKNSGTDHTLWESSIDI